MFNIELIRNNKEEIKNKLSARNYDVNNIDIIFDMDIKNRELKTNIQNYNSLRNKLSKEIGIAYGQKNIEKANELQNEVLNINKNIDLLEPEQIKLEKELLYLLSCIPNVCDVSVPIGKDENDNVPQKYFLEPINFNFNPLAHWDLAIKNKLIDFESSAKISGSRFTMYTDNGARLFRALQQFTLDHNVSHNFIEILPPTLILSDSLYGSGQLPKFKEDVYKIESEESTLFLSPTAEVQLVNYKRDEIITLDSLPLRYTANTPCYRSEAGSAGRDTRGVIRQHQFWKSELVVFSTPEDSWNEHEKITRTAELVLEKLELPYRRLLLCTGDTGFSSAKTYDLEVWLPSYNSYKEISSCSNCLDFQARRANIRTRNLEGKTIYVHTLNGSSLAIDRLWAAVVENYQQEDGSIKIPKALQPYMNGLSEIR